VAELTAVVTGAGAGIGKAIVRQFLALGYRVLGIGRRMDALERARREFGAERERFLLREADVRDPDALERAFTAVAPLHAVVANSGVVRQARLGALDARTVWRDVLSTNLDGVFNTLHAAEPHVADRGRLVIISSGLGKLGRPAFGAYAASKHGVLGLMKCVAKELAPRGITVNSVCPGWVDTDMARADIARFARDQRRDVREVEVDTLRGIPIGRFVRPDEVAALVSWLVSEDAGAVTGEAFNISGGEFFA
jgi:NAD(P)-dependent dehydrogenase (short-subunit alcohol dehydrogenase family)